jgi:putative tryptophan/tyrosine transport system substrate-binding protein
MAAELVHRQVSVIAATSTPANLVAKAATSTIPIVFTAGGDPVQQGLVASLSRPGGNVTGVSFVAGTLGAKRLDFVRQLRQLVPKAARIALLVNPNNPISQSQQIDTRTAASDIGQQVQILNASNPGEIDAAFVSLLERRSDALLVTTDPFFLSARDQLVTLAGRHAVPAIYWEREFVAGGLMSYRISLPDGCRPVGIYAGKILKGAAPAELPVFQSIKFEFVINLKTAKALGLTIQPSLLARADEVIECEATRESMPV